MSSVSAVHPSLKEAALIVTDVAKSFTLPGRDDLIHALKKVDLGPHSDFEGIHKGEFTMIRGPSGGGKTTLLNIIGTIDEPTRGEVTLFGESVSAESEDAYLADLRLRKIGFVFQTFNLLATMSAFENVELPMTILGRLSKSERKKRAKMLLDMVGLRDRYGHLPSELSGGEQQRVTIARALSNEPELLLLDEPTGDLDTRNTVDIMDLILKINRTERTTCVMVTHNPDLECYAHRILYVQDGGFVKQVINRFQSRLDFETYVKILREEQTTGPTTGEGKRSSTSADRKSSSEEGEEETVSRVSSSASKTQPLTSPLKYDPDANHDDFNPDSNAHSVGQSQRITLPPLIASPPDDVDHKNNNDGNDNTTVEA